LPKPSSILAAAALVVASLALWVSVRSLDGLAARTRVETALSLQRQFDVEYKLDRAECARAFLYGDTRRRKKKGAGLEGAPYDGVMDFFDTLGYLVDRSAVDEEMAKRYFAPSLDGYFDATKALLLKDQKKWPRRYERVFWLERRWHEEGPRPNLTEFFEDELDFTAPPHEESPRT
jgi:hypothetical protein